MKNLTIGVLVVLLAIVSFRSVDLKEFAPEPPKAAVNAVYEEYRPLIITAFDKAEQKYLVAKPDEEVVEGIDPDPAKCICKGKGVLPTDGNVVLYCKYHGNRSSDERFSALEQEIKLLKEEVAKEVVIDAPILQAGLEKLLKEREAAEQCKCTPEECAKGECKCGDNCKCHEVKDETLTKEAAKVETVKATPTKPYVRKDRPKNTVDKTNYQVIMFTAEWCLPCKTFKSGPLKDLYNSVENIEISRSASADFRVLDVDDPNVRDFYLSIRGGNTLVPLFVEIKDNTVISISPDTSYVKDATTRPKDLAYLISQYDFEEQR